MTRSLCCALAFLQGLAWAGSCRTCDGTEEPLPLDFSSADPWPSFDLTVVGNYEVRNVTFPRGLDLVHGQMLYTTDPGSGKIMYCNLLYSPGWMYPGPDMPESCGIPRDLASESGISCFYINDSQSDSIFFGYETWDTFHNPSERYGCGMDYDQYGYLWEAREDYIYRFEPGGTIQAFSLHVPRGLPCGLATFPISQTDGVGIAVTYLLDHVIEFYQFTPVSNWEYEGYGIVPWGYSGCHGMDNMYSHHFLVLVEGTTCWELLEVSADYVGLQQDTWGSIKAML